MKRLFHTRILQHGLLKTALLLLLLLAAAWLEAALIHRIGPRSVRIGGDDLGYATAWGYKEWSDTLPGMSGPITSGYRWSGAQSNVLFTPVTPRQSHEISLSLIGGRMDNTVVPVALTANEHQLTVIAVEPPLRQYHALLPADSIVNGKLYITLLTPTIRVGEDARDVGVIGTRVQLEELGTAVWWPRWTLPLLLLCVAVLVGVNGVSFTRMIAAAVLALALVLIFGLASPSLALATARTLTGLFAIAAAVVLVVRGGQRWLRSSRLRYPWRSATAGLVLLVSLLFTPAIASDGVAYYAYLRSLAVDRDLEFTNEFAGPDVPFRHAPTRYATTRTVTGRAANEHAVGPALVWTPLFIIGSITIMVGQLVGLSWTHDGYALPHVALTTLGSVLALPLTVWLGYRAVRPWNQRSIALLASGSVVFGSALLYFGLFEGAFPHTLAAAAVAAFFWWWSKTRPIRSTGQWLILGLLAGLMCLLYWINAILLLLPALDWLLLALGAARKRDWPRIGRLVGQGFVFVAALIAMFSPQMAVWQLLYGAPLTIPQGSGFAAPSELQALALLVSPLHGALLWAPIAVVAMLGFVPYIMHRRSEGLLVALVFSLYFLYNATLPDWHGSGTYGPRRLANVWPLLVPALASLLSVIRTKSRWLPLTLCTVCVTWSTAVMLRFITYHIPRQPSELDVLGIAEFMLAPDNLSWSLAGYVVRGALFPRLLRQATSGEQAQFMQFGLLFGVTMLVLIGWMYLLASVDKRLLQPSARPLQAVRATAEIESSRVADDPFVV